MTGEEFFTDGIAKVKTAYQELNPESFDNPLDYIYKKAQLEAEMQAYQSSMIEYRKYVVAASPEEAAILIHSYCKNMSDANRTKLGEVEKLENQEDEKVTSDRGRYNGLIDAYNDVRVYFDTKTSEYAAAHERNQKR